MACAAVVVRSPTRVIELPREDRVLHIVLRRQTVADFAEASAKLAGILDRFAEWENKDPFSAELFQWSFTTMENALAASDSDALLHTLSKAVSEFYTLHRNSMSPNAPFREPVLAGEGTWERWMLREYIRMRTEGGLAVISPFNRELILKYEDAVTHSFAIEMFEFVQSLPREEEGAIALFSGSMPYLLDEETFSRYPFVLRKYFFQEKEAVISAAKVLKESLLRNEALTKIIKEGAVSEAIEEVRAEMRENVANSQRDREAMQASFSDCETALRGKIQTVTESLEEKTEENRRNAAAVASLRSQVCSLQGQVNGLAGESHGHGCTVM